VKIRGIDVTLWLDRERFRPGDLELKQPVSALSLPLVDVDHTLPVDPIGGLEVGVYDDAAALIFGGYIARPVAKPQTGARVWDLSCHDWNVRLQEAPTGALNQEGVLKSDREFVIMIVRSCLKGQSFGAMTGIDDAVITVNEAIGWSGVQGTAVIAGGDWSHMEGANALNDVIRRVPNVYVRIRPDKVLEYGIPNERASIAFVSMPSSERVAAASIVEYHDYSEEELVGSHVNKLRRGGFGGAEVTARDDVSYGRFGRIIEGPFKDDDAVPASDLERLTYAELQALAVRRVIQLKTDDAPSITPGQIVPVVCDQLGAYESDGPFLDMWSFDAPSPTREPVDAWRGEFVVQRVEREILGADRISYTVTLGDYVPEFVAGVAVGI
jgi:hypothetical protein